LQNAARRGRSLQPSRNQIRHHHLWTLRFVDSGDDLTAESPEVRNCAKPPGSAPRRRPGSSCAAFRWRHPYLDSGRRSRVLFHPVLQAAKDANFARRT